MAVNGRSPQHVDSIADRPADAAAEASLAAERLVRLWENVERRVVPAVPPAQFRVLALVGRAGVLTPTKIAEMTGAMASSISRLCGRLQTAGLLVKEENCRNRREILVRLSPQGEALLRAAEEQRLSELRQLLARLSPRGQRALAAGLAAVSGSIALTEAPEAAHAGPGLPG